MSAQYKLRTQLTESDRGLVHIVIQLEKHLFIDAKKINMLRNVGDGIESIEEMIDGIGGVAHLLKSLGPESPATALIGLETEWKSMTEVGAEALLEKYYTISPEFNVILQGGVNNGSILITAGKASRSIPLNESQARSDKQKLEELKAYCDAHPPTTEKEVKGAIDAVVGVGNVTTSIIGVGEACLEGGLIGGLQGTAVGCIFGIISALGAFLGFVEGARAKQQKETEMRNHERLCGGRGEMAGGPSKEIIDRVGRTC